MRKLNERDIRNGEDLSGYVHHEFLNLRNIEYLVKTELFQSIFDYASHEAKKIAINLISNNDYEGIKNWYRNQRLKYIETLGVRELRTVAASLKIKHYNTLPKSLLLSEITRANQNEEGRIDSDHNPLERGDAAVDIGSGHQCQEV